METEDSFDVEAFVDEGIEAGGERLNQLDEEQGVVTAEEDNKPDPEETESKPEAEKDSGTEDVKSALESTEKDAEETEQTDSTISQLIETEQPEKQQTEGRVPLEDHVKLRKRAQAAEERAEEAERQLAERGTQTAGEKAEEADPLAEFEDDDLVRAGSVREAIGKAVETAVGQVNQTLESKNAAEAAQRLAAKAVESEAQVKAANPDYKEVTKAANKLGLLNDADRKAIFADENPAKKFYELSKAKLTDIRTTLGITPQSSTSEQQTTTEEETGEEAEDQDLTEEQIFEEVYGKPKE